MGKNKESPYAHFFYKKPGEKTLFFVRKKSGGRRLFLLQNLKIQDFKINDVGSSDSSVFIGVCNIQ